MRVENKIDENLSKEELINLLKKQEETIYSLTHDDRKYDNLFNNSLDGIYKSTPTGEFIDVNTALVKMLGYSSKEELLTIDIKSKIYKSLEDRYGVIKRFGAVEKVMHPIYKKDGTIIWVEDYGKNIYDNQGNVLYYEGIIRNVTEIKRASDVQKVLLNISQFDYKNHDIKDYNKYIIKELGKLFNVSDCFIAFYNKEKQTLNIPFLEGEDEINDLPIGKTMTGYLIKKKKPILINSEDFKELTDSGEVELVGPMSKAWLGVPLEANNNVIGALVMQSYEDENVFQEGDIKLLEFVSSHISIALERKINIEELAFSKEVLRKVLDNIPIKVFWKNKQSEFLGCNAAFLKDYGLSSEKEIIGKSDFDLNKEEDAKRFIANDVATMLSGKPNLNIEQVFVVNGKERWITTSKLPFFDENNEVIGVIGTSEDITDRIENQINLSKAKEEAIAANLSKSTFLSNMSHEIRTPMNAILGYSQLLQEANNLTKTQQNNLNTINKSGEHLLALINDILDMSKIESGRLTLESLDFNFIELIKEVEQLFKISAQHKNIDLSFEIGKRVPKAIKGDESKIKQVIINLIGNAIKFTSKGSVKVSIEAHKQNVLKIKVKDTGCGILKEEHVKVFKPFEQALKSNRLKSGTGLGLSISKKIANLMNGDITLQSKFGEGSEFTFEFKYIRGKESDLKEENEVLQIISLSPEMKGLKLAIVDDRFENRDILYKKFSPLGFEIKTAENGKEAVELYKNWKPDLIFMDVVMPVLNGVEATRQILEISGSHNVKIFVISASALESEQVEIMDLGATVFIKKPVIFNNLIEELQQKAGVNFLFKKKNDISEVKLEGKPLDVPLAFKNKLLKAAAQGDFMFLQELLIDLEKETNYSFKYIENSINEMDFEEIIKWFE